MPFDEAAALGAHQIIRRYLGLNEGQELLVIADETTMEVATIIADAAYKLRVPQTIVMVPVAFQRCIPKDIKLSMLTTGAAHEARAILTCVNGSPDCLPFRDHILESQWGVRTRIGHMPGANLDVLKLANVNFDQLVVNCHRLELALARGRQLEFISYAATGAPHTLTVNIGGWSRLPVASDGVIGDGMWGNVPSGETYIAPIENTAEGSIVINGSLPGLVIQPGNEIVLHFVAGQLIRIEPDDNKVALWLKQNEITRAQAIGDQSWSNLGEVGIGVNPAVDRLTGNMLFDEKSAGTAHIALGSNTFMGGKVDGTVHCDMVIKQPTIRVDGKSILELGEITLDETTWRENYRSISLTNSPVLSNAIVTRSGIEARNSEGRLFRVLRSEPGRVTKYFVGDDETARLVNSLYNSLPDDAGELVSIDMAIRSSGLDVNTAQRLMQLLWDYGLIELR